jgi:glutaconyl-CoA/methylmalonyl-CoA decarboxylase subunit gamma
MTMRIRVTVEGKSYEVDVDVLDDGGMLAQQPAAPPPPRPKAPAPAPAAAAPPPSSAPQVAVGEKTLAAPLTGTIRSIRAKAGDDVAQNEELMTLEAMKMETGVFSPRAGKIKAVFVSVNQAVQAGQPLAEFE